MSDGLILKQDSIVVKVDGTTVDPSKYTVVYTEGAKQSDDCTFEVKFADLKACGVPVTASSKVTVEFIATLNNNAVIGSAGNPNVAYLEYDNNPYGEGTGKTPEDKVIVFTYKLVANKVDKDGNALAGAGFTLYKFDSENNDYVQVGDEITGTTTFAFNGLDAGKYKLVETTVPAGYNKAEDLEFEVAATYDTDSVDPKLISLEIRSLDGAVISGEGKVFTTNLTEGSATTDVENLSGTELPSTGGIGTTIFYVIGGIMVGGAAILLITKKRMNGKAE